MTDYKKLEDFYGYLIRNGIGKLNQKWQDFSQYILESASKRILTIPRDTKLWRGRIKENALQDINGEIVSIRYPSSKMGKPPEEKAKEGRANFEGSPFLYLTEDTDTAVWELRPYRNAWINLCQFNIVKDINVIDAYSGSSSHLWFGIGLYYSAPISPYTKKRYLLTQYLTNLFRENNYDGVLYGSSQRDGGKVFVLFDDSCVETLDIIQEKRICEINYTDNYQLIKNKIKELTKT